MTARGLARRIEFGDLLVPLYATVFVRQCFWGVNNEVAAWTITSAVTLAAWSAYLYTKTATEERTPRLFWLLVALPLLIVFAARAPIPDLSFDVLNHRLIQGERALRGPQFLFGDFFPTIFPFNPSADMLTGLFRHALGYRLGTIVNLLALIWTGAVVEKLLRPWFGGRWFRCLSVLIILFTEHILFEINNYMVDLLALPLMLEALRLGLGLDESKTRPRDLIWSGLLLGGAMGLKLTNTAMVAPILIVFAVRVFALRRNRKLLGYAAAAAVICFLPLLPHAIYIYRATGSPVFPLYNNIFQSPLWASVQFFDGRWGPHNWRETLSWPLLTLFVPKRLSELGVYSGRLVIEFVAAVVCLLLPRIPARIRLIALVVLLTSICWSATSGYIRYALFVEILGGVLLLYLSGYIFKVLTSLPRAPRLALSALPLGLLVAQCIAAAVYVSRTEWSRRPVVFEDSAAFRKESRWIWRDHDLMKFQSVDNQRLFAQVDAWIVSSVKSNGVESLLRPDVPMLAVNNFEYFGQPEGRRRFALALDGLRGRRVYSLSLADEFDSALDVLNRRNLGVGEIRDLIIPFYSRRTQFHMKLIEVVLPDQSGVPRRLPGSPAVTNTTLPLSDDAFMAEISVTEVPAVLKAGQTTSVRVNVKNLSRTVWPSRGQPDGSLLIDIADAWFRNDGKSLVTNTDGRAGLPLDLWPGKAADIRLQITAPVQAGEYILEIDLVQEGVAWFKDKGSQTWRGRVKVE